MYKGDALKVLTGEVRLSYVNLTSPRQQTDQSGVAVGEPKYSVTLLIPKTDPETKRQMDAAFEAAAAEGVTEKWGGVRPQLQSVIHDGNGVKQSGLPFGPECKGHWVVTATTRTKPQVTSLETYPADLLPDEIYSGMYARVTVRFYPYFRANKRGVGCGLGNVIKTRDGERLSGGATARDDFAEIAAQFQQQAYPQAQAQAPYQATPPVPPQPPMPQPGFNQPVAQSVAQFTPVNPLEDMPF